MNKLSTLVILFLILFSSCGNKQNQNQTPLSLNVMSFNIWAGGGKSVNKTTEVILNCGADIVGIQEATNNRGKKMAIHIADSIGWYSYINSASQAVLSKYPIIDTSENKCGVKIKIDEKHFIWMFNVHLIHCPYEPYQLNGIEYCGAPNLGTEEEAVKSALKSREEQVKMTIVDILKVREEGFPIFLTGDFNEPSCLDWTPRAAEEGLHKISVKWPSTRLFIEDGGMTDSYRTKYPDEVTNPGITWTTIPEEKKYKEVLDRIDFVFFSGRNIEVTDSKIVGEKSPASDIKFDDYPSDHRAVLSTFNITK